MKQKHEEKEQKLEAKIEALENATTVNTQPIANVVQNLLFKCEQSNLWFGKKLN